MVIKKIGGVSPPHNKNTQFCEVKPLPTPKVVHIPMKMHSGKPAVPVVKAGDTVKVGQMIGEANGLVSAHVHSSVSGTVKSINDRDFVTGQKAVSITIETDGQQTIYDDLKPLAVKTQEEFFDAVRASGAVGLGGAGFPTHPKLAIKNLDQIEYVIINGAECEPYITSDTRTMVENFAEVYKGIKLLLEHIKPSKGVLLCIEANKPEAIQIMRETFADEEKVEIKVLPSLYPQGERKVIVYNLLGRVIMEGARLASVGVIILNVTTITAFAKYIETGIPLINRIVTVDGPSVKTPMNVLAPIGTPIRELFEFCGDFVDGEPKKVVVGGMMMGFAQPNMDVPVVKTTNCILAFPEHAVIKDIEGERKYRTACIKCGRCLTKCPMKLMPPNIENAYTLKKLDRLDHYKVNLCVECGSCAYVCPSKRPLVQVMQLSKEMLWLKQQELKAKAEEAAMVAAVKGALQ